MSHHPRPPIIPLDMQWVNATIINRSAVERRHEGEDPEQGQDRRREGPQKAHPTESSDDQIDRGDGPGHEHGGLEQ
ncbi:MAG: hypothetical protein EBS29_02325, partial [Chloroflexia bacterium]|nr:hypothetical protein [Chloroflexia bacterium]